MEALLAILHIFSTPVGFLRGIVPNVPRVSGRVVESCGFTAAKPWRAPHHRRCMIGMRQIDEKPGKRATHLQQAINLLADRMMRFVPAVAGEIGLKAAILLKARRHHLFITHDRHTALRHQRLAQCSDGSVPDFDSRCAESFRLIA